jgi:hypothetical protein
MSMQNNNPKSENPAMKERAAEAKDKKGRQQSTAREKAAKGHAESGQRRNTELQSRNSRPK